MLTARTVQQDIYKVMLSADDIEKFLNVFYVRHHNDRIEKRITLETLHHRTSTSADATGQTG
jgi:hypothetical protein